MQTGKGMAATARARLAAVIVTGAVALLAPVGTAQAQMELKTPPPPASAERWLERYVIPPDDRRDATRPSDADFYPDTPRVRHAPAFVAPLSTERPGGRMGFSLWTAPNTAVGARQASQPEQAGWFGFGLSIEFGKGGGTADAGDQ